MAQIPESFIENLTQQADIVDVIGGYISLKKAGSNFVANCPFHNEKTPSFSVSQTKQIYKCFGCSASGNAITFLMEYHKTSFIEAVKMLASIYHLEVPFVENQAIKKLDDNLFDCLNDAKNYYHNLLFSNLSFIASSYLKERRIKVATAKTFELGYSLNSYDDLNKKLQSKYQISTIENVFLAKHNENGNLYDVFRNRLMFPIKNSKGQTLAFGARSLDGKMPKYLNSAQTEIFDKSKNLYGLYELIQSKINFNSVIIVEGYLDVISLHQNDIKNVVATLGTATSEFHLQILFKRFEKLIFCFDGDKAGLAAAKKALEIGISHISTNKQIEFAFLPTNEDPDSFVQSKGKVAFEHFLQTKSKALSTFLIENATENLNLEIAEDKAKFKIKAQNLIKQIKDDNLKQILFKKIAETANLEISDFYERKAYKYNKKQERRLYVEQLNADSVLEKTLVFILLKFPYLTFDLKIATEILEQYHLLAYIQKLILENDIQNTTHLFALLISNQADLNNQKLLNLAKEKFSFTENAAKNEINDLIDRLNKEIIEKQLHNLRFAQMQAFENNDITQIQTLSEQIKILEMKMEQ